VINNERVDVYIKADSLSKSFYNETAGKKQLRGDGPHYFFTIGSVDVFHDQMKDVRSNYPEAAQIPITYVSKQDWTNMLLIWGVPLLLLLFLWRFIFRGISSGNSGINSAYSFGQTKARIQKRGAKNRVTFDDVAGLKEAKEEIYE